MDNLEPITRNEMFLNGDDLEPITREEMILAGADLEPITRHEWFLKKYRGGGGGGGYDLVNIPNLPADIASFNDGTDLPMASLKVAVTPYQDLSHGDPSPSNICPISGWDKAVVSVSGKNLFDYTKITAVSAGSIGDRNGTLFNKVGTYSVNAVNSGGYMYVRVFNSDGSIKSTYNVVVSTTITPATFTISSGEWFVVYDANPDTLDVSKGLFENWQVQVELSSQPTSYQPYNGATYTIDLNGTRYGGTLDATDGTFLDMIDHIASYNGETLPSTWISDRDVYAEGTTPTIGAEVVYPRATPITVQLSPTPVKSLEGTNNIFANCGQITEVKYFKKA